MITPPLQAAIDAMPAVGIRTFIMGKRGKPMTADTLAKELAKWATDAGLPDHCRLHGLKKGGLRRGAEKGLSTHELKSQSGHKTLAMIQHYTDAVDRKKLAASAFDKITKTG
jgi:integrase